MADQETLDRLRELVATVGPPVVSYSTRTVSSGFPELDEQLGGWPSPGVVEITGAVGAGRLSLVLPSVAMRTKKGEPVVIVDPLAMAHPPGWPGIAHRFLLVVRPPPGQAAWATEQAVSSGAVGLVVLLVPPRLGRAGARLVRAVERGGATLLVVAERCEKGLPAALRLEVGKGRVRVLRCRGRNDGQEFELPVAPPLAVPIVADDVIGQPDSRLS
jgi:hypothetical protein